MSDTRSAPARLRYLMASEASRAAMDGRPLPTLARPAPNPHLVCPHCQTKGSVARTTDRQKVGVSGGKLVAMILTAGISLLFVGLSRKQTVTRAACQVCGQTWTIT